MIDNIDTTLHLKNEAQFLCFTLEKEEDKESQLYAMNVFKVKEIIYYTDVLTETEGQQDGVLLGFLTVRGTTIPLVDMRRWLYYNPAEPNRDLRPFSVESPNDRSLVVICNFSNYTVGLKILGVRRIIQKNWSEVNVGSEFGIDGNSKVTATTKYDDGTVIQILDVERMVADVFPMQDASRQLELESISAIHSNRIVLLAEDSKTAAKSLQHIIERLELQYFTFPNGKALLDYLNNAGVAQMVGAIITDLEMPMISGFEVLKRVKENPETAHIPVIINSSMSSDSNRQMAEALKADAFITKSNPIEVEQALKRLLKS
ncbi:chemotaxis protein CheV [Helicobacter sp. MIT 00-7814]|uniref:chemotaxis protein n=1 Tax=unclassified Helicobacter TaxID=2593540 RepID=UPI000E1E9645|nr:MULTISPECIES: chemotaxis protein [unclassified Helicobacter]RDU52590.1 chemotaxis protein CheV [Helicobacter sp. MIT 99-10781]RDU52871.1 chemotaxis protein CheV [Helicobacter sp. MIT 00-7814]